MTRSVRSPGKDGPGGCDNSASCCQQDGDRVIDFIIVGAASTAYSRRRRTQEGAGIGGTPEAVDIRRER